MAIQVNEARPSAPWHFGYVKQTARASAEVQKEAEIRDYDAFALAVRAKAARGCSKTPASEKKVLILYTGGTLGMRKDDMGLLAPVEGYFTSLLYKMDEVQSTQMPKIDTIEYSPLLDSACFTPRDWERIALDIKTSYYGRP
jgi:L-asparaginase/Glu-tRNA(Gln) amidotransferase subunit D